MKKYAWLFIIPILLIGTFFLTRNKSNEVNFENEIANSNAPGTKSSPAKAPAAAVATPTPATAAKNRIPAQSEGSPLMKFLQSKDAQNQWNVQTHPDGRPSHILGGRLKSSSLQNLLKEVSPYLGVRPIDLKVAAEDDGSTISNSSQMNQYYGRHRVYGSNIKAFSNPKTGEVYHIVSDLRPLEDVDIRVSISREEAGEIARKSLGTAVISSIKISNEPVVYGTTPNDNQLVWRVQILSEKPTYLSREILIGAHSGAIVVDKSMLKH